LRQPNHRHLHQTILRCTLCGYEIPTGEEYWACNGNCICTDCLPAFAREEFSPCREIRGKEIFL
jgi:hypothetical protein